MREYVLAIDIGGGTQDILFYDSEKSLENCYKMVLPSPTVMVAQEIKHVTKLDKPLYLAGNLMGGGRCVRAIKEHLQMGLPVAAHPMAAKTIKDNLEMVAAMGIKLEVQVPKGYEIVKMGDFDLNKLTDICHQYGLEVPQKIAIAVQDHGESLHESNRIARFRMWQEFIKAGGEPLDIVYQQVPSKLTRMLAVQMEYPQAIVTDTGTAAVLGVLWDERVRQRAEDGLVIVNVGNQHTLGVYYQKGKVLGLFEHHTSKLTGEEIHQFVNQLIQGSLTHDQIFNSGGHGACLSQEMANVNKKPLLVLTGPNREKLKDYDYYQAAPGGDMMITGCFGLVTGALSKF